MSAISVLSEVKYVESSDVTDWRFIPNKVIDEKDFFFIFSFFHWHFFINSLQLELIFFYNFPMNFFCFGTSIHIWIKPIICNLKLMGAVEPALCKQTNTFSKNKFVKAKLYVCLSFSQVADAIIAFFSINLQLITFDSVKFKRVKEVLLQLVRWKWNSNESYSVYFMRASNRNFYVTLLSPYFQSKAFKVQELEGIFLFHILFVTHAPSIGHLY